MHKNARIGDKKEVFIVDDDASIGEILRSVLEEEYRVHVFTQGSGAISQLKKHVPNAIVLDYMLPGERAEDIIAAIRSETRDVVIILVSAQGSVRAKFASMGANDFIAKPFAREAILNALQRHLS